MNAHVQPDKALALAFAQALTGEDNPTVRLASLFEAPGKEGQAGEISGTIADLWTAIAGAQSDGNAIFIFPNEIEPVKGYANASNVVKYRVHFADFDKGFPTEWHRQPDMIVLTSIKDGVQRGQAYWLIEPTDAVTWRRNQRRLLAYYGDDSSVSDAIRRLRLPGSLHLKGQPQLVRFEDRRDPDAVLLGLPTSDDIVQGLPELKARVAGATATDDWAWSHHKAENVRKMYAHVDCVMQNDYGGWVGRIKLLAERGITLTESVPDEWWFDTAMAYCSGDLRRQYLDKSFPTPITFKDTTEGEVRDMFERADDKGGGKYTVHSLYLDAVEEGYKGPFDDRPASEVFKHVDLSASAPASARFHAVVPIPRKYRRQARIVGYKGRPQQDNKDDIDWHRVRTETLDPFSDSEVTELLTTTAFNKRRNREAVQAAARASFIAKALRRGYAPQGIFDLMMKHGDLRHMGTVKDDNDPTAKLREEIATLCQRIGDDLEKPVIKIKPGQEADVVDQIEGAIVELHVPIYETEGGVVTPGEFTYKSRRTGEDITTMRLLDMSAASFSDLVNRSVEMQKYNNTVKEWVPTDCPPNIAQNFMKRHGRHLLRPINGITMMPVLRPDGSILTSPGYDETTRLIYEPGGVEFPPVPNKPTKDDAAAALKFLLDPLRLVPFESADARAVMASGLLSLFARSIIDNVPLHGFDATTAGSGKTLMVDSASVIATGVEAQHMSIYPSDEENAKGLAALLKQSTPLISYDNVNLPLGFAQLERALTSERPQDRILGQSQTFTAVNNAVIFANGNNFTVKGDMARRTLIGRIIPEEEHPERRQFPFHPLDDFYAKDRPSYVVAALTVLRAHIIAGLPGRTDRLGSFEKWSDIVRGALLWLDLGDPVATQVQLKEQDMETARHSYLLQAWEACGRTLADASTADIMKAITSAAGGEAERAFADAIKEVAGGTDGKIDLREFGKYLEARAGRIVEGRRVERAGITHGRRRWKLICNAR